MYVYKPLYYCIAITRYNEPEGIFVCEGDEDYTIREYTHDDVAKSYDPRMRFNSIVEAASFWNKWGKELMHDYKCATSRWTAFAVLIEIDEHNKCGKVIDWRFI